MTYHRGNEFQSSKSVVVYHLRKRGVKLLLVMVLFIVDIWIKLSTYTRVTSEAKQSCLLQTAFQSAVFWVAITLEK